MKYDFYITGSIGETYDWWTGQRGTTADMVQDFLKRNKDKEVNIAVSSPGGLLNEGITIAEMIAAHGKCNMVIIGMTASSATVLCMKAKSVQIARGSLLLIHNSSQYIRGLGQSNKRELDNYIENLKKTRDSLDTIDKAIADFYSYRNGKSIEDNLAMMDEDRWMTDKEAFDFGIVDSILDDESQTQAKAIQNVYASYKGIEKHYYLPPFPHFDNAEEKIPKGIMARLKDIFNEFKSNSDKDNNIDSNNTDNIETMNKNFINVNALLKVEGLNETTNGVELTKDQVQAIDDFISKNKDNDKSSLEDQLTQARQEKETAETAKADAEKKLADLQKDFDDFKKQAGDDTRRKPADDDTKNEPANAKTMYNSVKNLI